MPTVLLYTRPTIDGRRKYVPADPKLKNNQGTFFLRYKVGGKDVWETTHTKTYIGYDRPAAGRILRTATLTVR